MSPLAEAQALFWQAVRFDPAPPEVDDVFAGAGALPARAGLAIYRTAYWVRQVEVLRELFPSVVSALGDGPFARLASRYIGAHPSRSPAIEALGAGFPDHVRASAHAGLADAAALDWAMFEVSVAPDVAVVTPAQLEGVDLGRCVLRVAPHVRVVPHGTAVWREGHRVFHEPIPQGEADALVAARQGIAFGLWCELMLGGAECDDAAAVRLHHRLGQQIHRGWYVAFEETP